MVADATRQVIGTADPNVLVVPRLAAIWRKRILIATDGSLHSESAAVVAGRLAKMFAVPVSVVSRMNLRIRCEKATSSPARIGSNRPFYAGSIGRVGLAAPVSMPEGAVTRYNARAVDRPIIIHWQS